MKTLFTIGILLAFSTLLRAQNNMYGMTPEGGINSHGIIFKVDSNGNNQTLVHKFQPNYEGVISRKSKLCLASNGKFYGMTRNGGISVLSDKSGYGVIFEFDPVTNIYTKKIDFDGLNKGRNPESSLIKASNGKLYGLTAFGGLYDKGTLFEYDPLTNTFVKKIDFDSINNGSHPYGALIEASNGKLYGLTSEGGVNNDGVLFEYNIATNILIKKVNFQSNLTGSKPKGTLMQATNGKLYGYTTAGTSNYYGGIFEYNISTSTLANKYSFGYYDGRSSYGFLTQANNGKLYGLSLLGGNNGVGVLFEFDISNYTYSKKVEFSSGSNGGYYPWGNSLMKAPNGKLYGLITYGGGLYNGVLFEYNCTTNTFTKLIDFDEYSMGKSPHGNLVQLTNNQLISTTTNGGDNGHGTIFVYDIANNTVEKKFSFGNADNGRAPVGSLVEATNGRLYGMTYDGGIHNNGILFELNPANNSFVKILAFDDTLKGGKPRGSLIQATNGKLYGTTNKGGLFNQGVLFEYDIKTKVFTKKIDFKDSLRGSFPIGALLQASNGLIYGMTTLGGSNNDGCLFEFNPVTSSFTKKADFDYIQTGRNPKGFLIQGSNGKLYGLTTSGGFSNYGTLIEYNISTDSLIKRVDFNTFARNPQGSLVEASNGKFYGFSLNGYLNDGSIFEYDPVNNTFTPDKFEFDMYNSYGWNPKGTLIQTVNGKLFGLIYRGSTYDRGTILEYNYVAGTATVTHIFNDTNGAHPTGYLVQVNNSLNISFSASSNNLVSPPFSVTFTNTSSGYHTYNWDFGDGQLSSQLNPVHTYQYNGIYKVILYATDTVYNITDTVSTIITCSNGNPNPCNFVAELTQPQSSAQICFGDSIRLSTTPLPSATYKWLLNGTQVVGATDSIFYAKQLGTYTAVISQGSCAKSTINSFVLTNYAQSNPVISISGSMGNCLTDSILLKATPGYSSYLWSNGNGNDSIYVKTSAYYNVVAYDINGCANQSQQLLVNFSVASTPSICSVTIDGVSKHNTVKWQSPAQLNIDSFKVYHKSAIDTSFIFIGSVAYNAPYLFEDVSSNVDSCSYNYVLSVVDTCGKETPFSSQHKTMFLSVNTVNYQHWNLTWSPYLGFNYGNYRIFRGTDSLNMILLTTVSQNNNSYTDTLNGLTAAYYQIEVESSSPCQNTTNGLSKSNIYNTGNILGVGHSIVQGKKTSMLIYPNPNHGDFKVNIKTNDNRRAKFLLTIYSSIGSLIYQEVIQGKGVINKSLNLNGLSRGVYFVHLKSNDEYLTSKFIIQ